MERVGCSDGGLRKGCSWKAGLWTEEVEGIPVHMSPGPLHLLVGEVGWVGRGNP